MNQNDNRSMSENPPEICIVEDDVSAGKSLKRLIAALGYESCLYSDAATFLQDGRYKHAACVLLDIKLPDLDGLQIQEILGQDGSAVPVIFLTGVGDVPMSVRAMKAGAVDFLQKPVEEDTLISALARAIQISNAQSDEVQQRDILRGLLQTLTPREKEVFRAVLTGAMNKQIAGHLGIAEKTVKIHRGQVMQKLRAKTIVDLIAIANLCGVSADPELKR